ncbi:MAG: serine/threonine-protein kinase [Myxococcota bacterium]
MGRNKPQKRKPELPTPWSEPSGRNIEQSNEVRPIATELVTGSAGDGWGEDRITGSEPASPDEFEPNRFLGPYEVLEQLGRGGMGTVFLARDMRLGRLVALKCLSSERQSLAQRFLTEARLTARCKHDNIVDIYQVDEIDGRPFMALEYVEGQTLRSHISGHTDAVEHPPTGAVLGAVSPTRAAELMVPVVRALVHAHTLGIVHRDLKPENIMLAEGGPIKVLDFGIAKLLADEAISIATAEKSLLSGSIDMTGPGAILGTIPYMSPEQLSGGDVDGRSDIWAMGIMLYELVAGQHPLAPLARDRFIRVPVLDEPMPRVSERIPELGPLAPIIDRCLLKRKADRTGSARVLLAELERLLPDHQAAARFEYQAPYVGLTAFQESDADRFFGRDHDIAHMMARLRHQPLVTIVGPSGCGKSSFVRAGVIPALKRSGEGFKIAVLRPGRSPLGALASALRQVSPSTDEASADLAGEARQFDTLLSTLRTQPGYAGMRLRAHASDTVRQILLFVDQLEELYMRDVDAEERAAFAACLDSAANDPSSPIRVVLAVRSEFLDRLLDERQLMPGITRELMFLPALGRDGLRTALLGPAQALDYRFEDPEVTDQDARGDGAGPDSPVARIVHTVEHAPSLLPMLQLAAVRLWDERDHERRLLTGAAYSRMGGVTGALAAHADAVLAGLSARERPLARAIFTHLVTRAGAPTSASLTELRALTPGDDTDRGDTIERVAHHLADARLLVIRTARAGHDHAEPRQSDVDPTARLVVSLVHTSLIERWPKLARWLDERAREDERADAGAVAQGERGAGLEPGRRLLVCALAVAVVALLVVAGYVLGHRAGASERASPERAAAAGPSAAEASAEDGLRGWRSLLEAQLERRFGPLPDAARARLAQASIAQLTAWSERAVTASSLGEVLIEP